MSRSGASSAHAALEAVVTAERIPGCAIALVDRDGTRWCTGIGFADLRSRRPATPSTVYHLFSGTKLFTATAVVQLAERGRLSLDDEITSHLPEMRAASGITLTHLLSHQSGLKDSLRSFLAVTFPPSPVSRSAEALARYPIVRESPPGAKVAYRNVNYALLAEVITRAAGVEYGTFVETEILRPLGMDAAFTVTPELRHRAATGYIDRRDPMRLVLWALFPDARGRLYGDAIDGHVELRDFDLATPGIGGLVGSVEDFARFVHAQLTDGGGVISADSVRRMQTMVARGAAGIESREGVGLGWKFGRAGGHTFLNHEGGGAGFTTELRLYPEVGLGVVIAMNAMRMPATMRLAHRLCETIHARRDQLLGVADADARSGPPTP